MKTVELIRTDEPVLQFTERVLEAAGLATPDFADVPIYAIQFPMSNCRGLWVPGLARTFEAELRAAGKWDGPGPGILLDSSRRFLNAYLAAGGVPTMTHRKADKFAHLCIAALITHELSHALDDGDRGQHEPVGGRGAELSKKSLIKCVSDSGDGSKWQDEREAPWAKHGPRFVRACAHLTHRMRRFLPDLKYCDTFIGDNYALSSADSYVFPLLHELSSQRPIAELLASKPPSGFVDRWRGDVHRWYQAIDHPTPEQSDIAEAGLALCPK